MPRTIIVGDVHGCRAELDALLDRLAFCTGDKLVFVGDLVARGPDSLGVLDIARRTGAVLVRGNHEEKLLAWRGVASSVLGEAPHDAHANGNAMWEKVRTSRRRAAVALGRMHMDIARVLRPVDWTLLATSPLYYQLPDHNCTVVHAGLLPGLPVEDQAWDTLMHIRSVSARGTPSSDKEGTLWGQIYAGPTHVVFGHNAMPEPQIHRWATGLDTACVYGGRLTAMVLHEGDVVPRGRAVRELLVHQQAFRLYYDWQSKKKKVA